MRLFLSLTAILAAAFVWLNPQQPAKAAEWMSSKELITHCSIYREFPTSLDGIVCAAYIQGFLGGADATDGAVARVFESQTKEGSSFSERVLNTRIGSRIERYGNIAYADICIPAMAPLAEIINVAIQYLDNPDHKNAATAQEFVYDALHLAYPCPK